MQGLLLVDKPVGWTSFDAVNYIRKIVAQSEGSKPKSVKVGHTGTLDPLATGLLVLLIGKAYTRRAAELSKADKTYEVEMKLGENSTTGDGEGDRQVISDRRPTSEEIRAALQKFTGHIMQTPPQFSAMKIGGQRAYQLARAGRPVELEARPVTVYETDLKSYEYPVVRFTSSVSSGTYIRSLVTDLGGELGTGAWMSNLRRIRIGGFSLDNAQEVSGMTPETIRDALLTAWES